MTESTSRNTTTPPAWRRERDPLPAVWPASRRPVDELPPHQWPRLWRWSWHSLSRWHHTGARLSPRRHFERREGCERERLRFDGKALREGGPALSPGARRGDRACGGNGGGKDRRPQPDATPGR